LAFTRKFTPGCQSPRLYAERNLIPEIWNALCPGLNSIEGQVTHLEDFYSVHPVDVNDSFTWEGICFSPVQTVHVMAGKKIKNSFGLIIEHNGKKVYFTTDTQFCPSQLDVFYKEADAIFQDCETSKFPSRVHAHYDVLKNLSLDIKGKMWLYHYQPYPEQDSVSDGFKGFAKKGQVYEF
jgi:ribonuclease BN (tRNA processing enzyme)